MIIVKKDYKFGFRYKLFHQSYGPISLRVLEVQTISQLKMYQIANKKSRSLGIANTRWLNYQKFNNVRGQDAYPYSPRSRAI